MKKLCITVLVKQLQMVKNGPKNNMQKFGLLPNWGGGGQAEGVNNQTAYKNFYFLETCCIDSQTFKSWRYVEK